MLKSNAFGATLLPGAKRKWGALAAPFAILASGEFLLGVFLLSGYIKSGISFPVDLTFFLMAVTMLLYFVRLMQSQELPKPALIPLLLFVLLIGYILFSFSYSTSYSFAIQKTSRFMLLTAWSFIGPFLLIRDKKGLERFFVGIIAVSSLMTFYCLQMFLEKLQAGQFIGQIEVLGSDYLSLGRTNGIAVIALIGLYLYNPLLRTPAKIVASLFLALTFLSVAVSGARTPLITLVGTIVLIMFLSVKVNRGKITFSKGVGTLFFIILLLAALAVPLVASGVMDTFIYRISVLFNQPGGGESAEGRVERYAVAWQMIQDHFFFGGGIGSFTIAFAHEDVSNYPHNIFLELWSELGLAGVLLFLAIFWGAVRAAAHFIAGKMTDRFTLVTVFSVVFLFLNANVSGDLNENRLLFCYVAIAWLLPYATLQERKPLDLFRK
ncbi:O-antigen ligase family protein [Paenibacillus sp. Leaf72]|uniref:O-antigen ligase family protein n=1 Tax=Paenibacillus sp. Leaf72 TaxID=1736234 RepID=UPI0006F89ED6|nr:O-antigen ligase family protein [Paenibacillus sp. Leaf72]KQO06252.1 hypothetical protein ASF12_32660 [Paenibacillus sp. Leaf72]